MKKITLEDLHDGDEIYYVESNDDLFFRLWKTIHWAKKIGVKRKIISDLCYSLINNLNWQFSENSIKVDCNIGDIVICDFGANLPGEISGHKFAIVVDYSEITDMLYLVPIFKEKEVVRYDGFVRISPKENLNINGVVIIELGMYVNPMRIDTVAGKVSEEFIEKIKKELKTTVGFKRSSKERMLRKIFSKEIRDSKNMNDFFNRIGLVYEIKNVLHCNTYKEIGSVLGIDETCLRRSFKEWKKQKLLEDSTITITLIDILRFARKFFD